MNPQFTGNASDSFARPHLFFFPPFVPIDVHIFLSSKIYEKIFQYRQRSNGEEKTNTRYIRIQYSILVRRQCGKREREREGRSRVEME